MTEASYYGQTTLHPLGLLAIVLLGAATLAVPRRWAGLPMIVMACFVAPAQRVVIASLDFHLLRIMVLFGWMRLVLWNEVSGVRPRPLDGVLILWTLVGVAAYAAYYGTAQALVFRLGSAFDAIGLYFFYRCIIRSWSDLETLIGGAIIVAVPVAIAFALEWSTGRNAFSLLGGVPELTEVRDGRLRCQGAFAHPILAGCFWASLFPIFIAYRHGRFRTPWRAVVGGVAAFALVLMSASSTPAMGLIFAIVGMAVFPLRRLMPLARGGAIAALVALHFLMSGPVWGLLARVNILSSSTGWHRYYLIEQAIAHFDEWWLMGTATTEHWGWGLWDVTNQYILEGVRGGLAAMLLFILGIVLAFGAVGRTVRAAEADPVRRRIAWALGVALFVHAMNFLAVSYFGQIVVPWYLLLAAIASLDPGRAAVARRATAQRVAPRAMPGGAEGATS